MSRTSSRHSLLTANTLLGAVMCLTTGCLSEAQPEPTLRRSPIPQRESVTVTESQADRLNRGCQEGKGDADDCRRLASMLADGDTASKTQAVALMTKLCLAQNDHAACRVTLKVAEKMCEANQAIGCGMAGEMYRTTADNGISQNLTLALMYFRKGCALGSRPCCRLLDNHY